MNKLKRLFQSEQAVVLSFFFLLFIIIGILNPSKFFTINTLFDLLKNSIVPGILAIGVLIIMIFGGVDLSFSAIGAFSSYVTIKLANLLFPNISLVVIFLICILIGVFLGFINAILVSYSNLPILVVTLGTSTMIYGFLLFFIDNKIIMDLPSKLSSFSKSSLISFQNEIGTSNLHTSILVLIILAAIISFIFNYMKTGRMIFAVGGGGRDLASRVGINVRNQDLIVFTLSGGIAALGGICNASLFRYANPVIFRGDELDIIAAVVIGGASISGGKGSVLSTIIGVLLINLIKNNLIMIGIPS